MDIGDSMNPLSSSEDTSENEEGNEAAPQEQSDEESRTRGDYTWEDYIDEYGPGPVPVDEDAGSGILSGPSSDVETREPEYEDLDDDIRHDDLRYEIDEQIGAAGTIGEELNEVIERRTVNVRDDVDEDEFFSTADGVSTLVTRYDLEKSVSLKKKEHFEEIERYWVNKPFAFVMLFRSTKENEVKYFAIEPHLNAEEEQLLDFLQEKLQDRIKFAEEAEQGRKTDAQRAQIIERETFKLLYRYELLDSSPFEELEEEESSSWFSNLSIPFISGDDEPEAHTEGIDETEDEEDESTDEKSSRFSMPSLPFRGGDDDGEGKRSIADKVTEMQKKEDDGLQATSNPLYTYTRPEEMPELKYNKARPQTATINRKDGKLTDYQALKLLYYLKRNSVSYGKIDPIKHDISVEDISCDGYNSRVFVYHEEHEQIISNIWHERDELDNFVINLAQRSGKGISKRQPQVDATLPDGSRAQLTLGKEVSDHGTNYTIRQFQEIPHTPIDLINWRTFSPDEMTFLWLAIENNKSLVFAGGTASGKTTSLNAVSLFIPSNSKIVSIEDTREVELPQRNWVASVTRPSFTQDGAGDVDEFALLEAALRQRPDYIVMGEIRGEEGRTLFQVMSTGHTTYTTFHADSVGEVIKRFTTDPINVSKTLFAALDMVSIQTQTRVDGHKVRRNKVLTEVNDYVSETDEINVNDVFTWIADTDTFKQSSNSELLETIKFDRGWSEAELQLELDKRKVVLAYLIKNRLNTYTDVAATVQAFINEQDVILNLIANNKLEGSLDNLRTMESVEIDIDQEKEEMVPRPEPADEVLEWSHDTLQNQGKKILENRDGASPEALLNALEESIEEIEAIDETGDLDDEDKLVKSIMENSSESDGENTSGYLATGLDEEPTGNEETVEQEESNGVDNTAETYEEMQFDDFVNADDEDEEGDGFTVNEEGSETNDE